jgi:Kinesin protein 1B
VSPSHSLLDEKLLKTIPLVNEANAYSEELGVGLAFSVKLMSLPGRKPAVAASGAGDDDSSQHSAVLDTDVFVRVDTSVSATFATPAQSSQKFWTYDKFMDRLYNMREMYQKYVESGRSLEGTEYCFNKQLDPFYDEPEDHMIGRATVYLDPLVYVMFIDEWTPVIDYKGQTQGELLLRVIPHAKPEPPKGDPESWDTSEGTGFDVDSLDELKQQRIYITVGQSTLTVTVPVWFMGLCGCRCLCWLVAASHLIAARTISSSFGSISRKSAARIAPPPVQSILNSIFPRPCRLWSRRSCNSTCRRKPWSLKCLVGKASMKT